MGYTNDKMILAYTGQELLAGFLKDQLEEAGFKVFLRSEGESGRTAGFGSTGAAYLHLFEKDMEKAKPIIEDFIQQNE